MENSILHNKGTGNEPLTIEQFRYDCKYIVDKQGDWPDEFFGSRNCFRVYYLTRLVAKYYSFIQENKETSNYVSSAHRQFKERIDHFLENIHKIKHEKYIKESPERYERMKAALEKYQKLYGGQPEVEDHPEVEVGDYVSVYYNSYL